MKLVSWNVNGIRAVHNKGLFVPMVETLKPDVICLQETKAERGQAELDLSEYEEYWNSAQKKGYSGTAIFTKQKPLSVFLDFPESIVSSFQLRDGYGDLNNEGRVIALEFEEFHLVNCYTPNVKRDLTRLEMRHQHWDPAFFAYCALLGERKPVVFCGDLNVAHTEKDLERPKENEGLAGYTKEERGGFEKYMHAGYKDTYRLFHEGGGVYTWWSNFNNARARNIGWRIDYFMAHSSLEKRIVSADIHNEYKGSDHCPVSLVLE